MFYFVIPLRSKYSSNNWKGVVKSFNSTIKSIYNQSSANFKILVACHDNPELLMSTDDRLKIFKMDTPVPEGFDQQMMDKFYKKRFLMSEIRKMNEEGFVMFTDADDYVNHRLVSFTEKNNDKYGFFFIGDMNMIFKRIN